MRKFAGSQQCRRQLINSDFTLIALCAESVFIDTIVLIHINSRQAPGHYSIGHVFPEA